MRRRIMAFITCEFKSTVLFERTTINVVLPDDVFEDIPTVYLLHGLSGDAIRGLV